MKNILDYINGEATFPDGYIVSVTNKRVHKSVRLDLKVLGVDLKKIQEDSNCGQNLKEYISANSISYLGKTIDRQIDKIPNRLKMRLINKSRLGSDSKSYKDASFSNNGVFLLEDDTYQFIDSFVEAKKEYDTIIKDIANKLPYYKQELKEILMSQLLCLNNVLYRDIERYIEEIMGGFPNKESFQNNTKMELNMLKVVNDSSPVGVQTKASNYMTAFKPVLLGLFANMQKLYDCYMKNRKVSLQTISSLQKSLEQAKQRNNNVFTLIDEIKFTLNDVDILANECYGSAYKIYCLLRDIGEEECLNLYAFNDFDSINLKILNS